MSGAYIESITRDLVVTGAKDLQRPASPLLQAIYLRLATHRGSCFWDPSFGSTLHELAASHPSAVTVARDVDARVRDALQPLIDSGDLKQLDVTVTRQGRHQVALAVSVKDAGRRTITFTTFVQV